MMGMVLEVCVAAGDDNWLGQCDCFSRNFLPINPYIVDSGCTVHVKDVWVMEDVLCTTCQHVLFLNIPGKYRLITVAQHNRPVLQF